jgi:hypothetical protein
VFIFNFVNDKIRKLYQDGDSGTACHEIMLHDRNMWPDDWCNFIANHLLKKLWYHRQNGYPTIAREKPLLKIGMTKDSFKTTGKMPVDEVDKVDKIGQLRPISSVWMAKCRQVPDSSVHPAPKWPPLKWLTRDTLCVVRHASRPAKCRA